MPNICLLLVLKNNLNVIGIQPKQIQARQQWHCMYIRLPQNSKIIRASKNMCSTQAERQQQHHCQNIGVGLRDVLVYRFKVGAQNFVYTNFSLYAMDIFRIMESGGGFELLNVDGLKMRRLLAGSSQAWHRMKHSHANTHNSRPYRCVKKQFA